MILREATIDDVQPAFRLAKKSWKHLGIPFDKEVSPFPFSNPRGARMIVAYEGKKLLAVLAARPINTDKGLGYQVYLYVTDPDELNPALALDAVSFYSCILANSEGKHVVLSRSIKAVPATFYGRDTLGMDAFDDGPNFLQVGDTRSIVVNIIQRRPQWALSL